MRPILFVVSALVVLCAGDAFAKPPEKARRRACAGRPAPTRAAGRRRPPLSRRRPRRPRLWRGRRVRGPTRIDFDDRLIQGQSNKSGAVYLYDRKELKIRSMIKKRENFRDEIVGSLYDT